MKYAGHNDPIVRMLAKVELEEVYDRLFSREASESKDLVPVRGILTPSGEIVYETHNEEIEDEEQ